MAALAQQPPLAQTPDGGLVHPVVLVHDPSPADTGATPVGVCAITGYIGSAWNAHATVARQAPDSGVAHSYLVRCPVTVVVLTQDGHGVGAKVWLPTPDQQ